MKNSMKRMKVLGLLAILGLCLMLTGCVVPPDDIDNAGGFVVNDPSVPFQDIAPPTKVITEPPTTTPPVTTPPASQVTNPFTWPNQGSSAVTTDPAQTGSNVLQNIGNLYNPVGGSAATPSVDTGTTQTNAPSSNGTLRKGDKGNEVSQLQQKLKNLGFLSGSADGDFGTATENAVKAFQQRNGLTADGVAGSATLAKLNSNTALGATSQSTARRTASPTPGSTATPNLSTDYYLEVGSSGSRVRTLQNRLIELGWMDGNADGDYQGATEYAVIAFQKKYASLEADGVAGPATLKLLYSSGAKKSSTPASSIGANLAQGSKSDAVKALQTRLKSLGYLSGSADGDFGEATKAAVIAFQTNNGLKADGRAGTSTLNKVYSKNAKGANNYNPADEEDDLTDSAGDVFVNGYYVLKEGSRSDEVKKLQQALKNRGYFSNSITGYFGEATKAAVMAFQQNNGLTADGVAGPATQNLLYDTSSASGYETLRYGDSGTEVKNLQYTLHELGYYDGDLDGSYGATTRDAVRAFQIQNDITPVDGVAGNKTLQRLYSNKAIAASASTGKYTALKKGDKGDLVVQMQEKLAKLGYLYEPTGYYDNATVEAVKNFQRRNGLTADGAAGQATLKVLYGSNPKTAY